MDHAIRLVKFGVLLVVIANWAVVGMMFWLPLLVRATSAISLRVLHSTLTVQVAQGMDAQLETTYGFYICGFKAIADIAWSSHPPAQPARPHLSIVLVEIFWAVTVWIAESVTMGLASTHVTAGTFRQVVEGLLNGLAVLWSRLS